jgi:hypothetical protein
MLRQKVIAQDRETILSREPVNLVLVQRPCKLVSSWRKSLLPLLQDRPPRLVGRMQTHVVHTKTFRLR